MNMKKLVVLGLFLVVVASSVAAISAQSGSEIDIEGITFKIPDGYTPYESESDASTSGEVEDIDGIAIDTEKTSEYKNAAGDELEIKVGVKTNQKIDSLPQSGEKKQIADKDGVLLKEMDDGKDKYEFKYLQDGKLVKITAVSEDIIKQVIA
jgi:hypothetical protein